MRRTTLKTNKISLRDIKVTSVESRETPNIGRWGVESARLDDPATLTAQVVYIGGKQGAGCEDVFGADTASHYCVADPASAVC